MIMHNIFVLLTVIFLMASCHRGANQQYGEASKHHLRFNPPDSSTYRYNTTSETIITITENDSPFSMHRSSRFTVNYLISKDSNEVMLEMTFDGIDYYERNSHGGVEVDLANEPGPTRDLLNRMKTATMFVRVRPAGPFVTISGAQELVDAAMDSYYVEAHIPQARKYWGQWVEQELVWKNLDPLVWVTFDSARHPGDHWTDTSTNEEDINFKINKRFQFDAINAGIATIRSQGRIGNDSAGTWLSGKPVMGMLTGKEEGKCLVDTATGMLAEMDDSVSAEGNVQIEGRKARIKIIKTVAMVGGKLK
jgi:hypothetical protein